MILPEQNEDYDKALEINPEDYNTFGRRGMPGITRMISRERLPTSLKH
jgi:hypothetical protein